MSLYLLKALCHGPTSELAMYTLHANATITNTAMMTAWLAALDDQWSNAAHKFATLANSNVGLDSATVVEIDVATGKQLSRLDQAHSIPGLGVGTSMPPEVAECVSLRTLLPQRAGRGRFFMPPIETGNVSAGKIAAAAVTIIANGAAGMIGILKSNGATPVLYGRTSHVTRNITSIDVGNLFDTQRRRQNKTIETRTSVTV
jgi:hypothetical protein